MRPAGLPLVQDDNASVELEPHVPQGAQASESSAPVRSQGQIPEGMQGHGEGADGLKKTEGPLENPDGLERDMENFMFDFLQKQNEELRQQVDALKAQVESKVQSSASGTSGGSWAAVTPEPQVKPKEPTTPRMENSMMWTSCSEKRTPGGTQVPEGPPPTSMSPILRAKADLPKVPPMPEWLLQDYEIVDKNPQEFHGPVFGAQELHAGLRGHSGVLHGNVSAARERQGVRDFGGPPGLGALRGGEVLLPREARTKWLEREVEALKSLMLQQQAGQQKSRPVLDERYWSMPVTRHVVPEPPPPGPPPEGEDNLLLRGYERKETSVREDSMRQNYGGMESRYIELPKLEEQSGNLDSLKLGDWLYSCRPFLTDLSAVAPTWWEKVQASAMGYYNRWRLATPLERVRITPDLPSELKDDPRYERTEQRGIQLLLKAIPVSVKEQVIAMRMITSVAIVYSLLIRFQPGGPGEKQQLLRGLVSMDPQKDSKDWLEEVRKWRRTFQRASEVEASLPDPILMIRAFDGPASHVAKADPQASFRLAQSRMELAVDEKPTTDKVWVFSQVVAAELETLTLLDGPLVKWEDDGDRKQQAKVKAIQGSPGQASSPVKPTSPCRYWGTSNGCNRGRKCPYGHDWQNVQDKASRCWSCSALSHTKANCPFRTEEDSGKKETSSTSTSSSKGKSGGGGKDGGKKGGKGKGQNEKQVASMSVAEEEKSSAMVSPETALQPQVSNGGSDTLVSLSSSSSEKGELIGEVSSLLKTLKFDGKIAAVKVSSINLKTEKDQPVLLDGGATHCLRPPRDEEEWSQGHTVDVSLASGKVQLRQNDSIGTLLAHGCQPIVPMAHLTWIGCTVKWDGSGCVVHHPKLGRLPVWLENGCPHVSFKVGMQLMEEVERWQFSKRIREGALLRLANVEEVPMDYPVLREMRLISNFFPEVPHEVLVQLPLRGDYDPVRLPYNRHKRRALKKAKTIFVHLFSGPGQSKWQRQMPPGTEILCVDLLRGQDLLDDHVWHFVLEVLRDPRCKGLLLGPPCRTVSVCRNGPPGPRRVRAREGPQRWGLDGMTEAEKEMVQKDNVLWMRGLVCVLVGHEAHEGDFETTLEQPEDPEEYRPDSLDPQPSFLAFPEVKLVQQLCNLQAARFDQGCMGHQRRKPTEVMSLHGMRGMKSPIRPWPDDLNEAIALSSQLSEWSEGLVHACLDACERLAKRDEIPGRAIRALQAAASETELLEWKRHIDSDHVPFRRDCAECLYGGGRDRQHRRVAFPESWCMNIDLGGPHAEGVDQNREKVRYFLVAVVTIPLKDGRPLLPTWNQNEFMEEDALCSGEREFVEDLDEQGINPFNHVDDGSKEPEAVISVKNVAEQMFKEKVAGLKDVEVANLTFVTTLANRKAENVVNAVSGIYSRVRSLGVPIRRVHADRARELLSVPFQKWCKERDLLFTSTAGDDAAASGRVESELGIIKARTRILLRMAGQDTVHWPLALRHAGEHRLRRQLAGFGIPVPQMLPYGCYAMAKKKSWDDRYRSWREPYEKVRVLGPACDMSISSSGYFVQRPCGKFARTTIVVVPKEKPEMGDRVLAGAGEDGGDGRPDGHGRLEPGEPNFEVPDDFPYSPEVESPVRVGVNFDNLDEVQAVVAPLTHPKPVRRALIGKQKPPPPHRCRGKQPQPTLKRVGGECYAECRDCGLMQEMGGACFFCEEPMSSAGETDFEEAFCSFCSEQGNLSACDFEAFGGELHPMFVEDEFEDRIEDWQPKIATMSLEEVEEECLQTHNVSAQKVREEFPLWEDAIKKELRNLLDSGAMVEVDEQQQWALQQATGVERIPSKLITLKKAPHGTKKARLVACGNFSETQGQVTETEKAAGGADATALRMMVRVAAEHQWLVSSLDVKAAFLLAPRRKASRISTIMKPPALLVQMGLVPSGVHWLINKAVYGMVESPADWGAFRDKTLRVLRWSSGDKEYVTKPTKETHIWEIVEVSSGETMGFLATYVDDFMFIGVHSVIRDLMKKISSTWECSSAEEVSVGRVMRFCGFEIEMKENLEQGEKTFDYILHQKSYTKDLLERYNVNLEFEVPAPKIGPKVEQREKTGDYAEKLKKSQAVCGALLWLVTRTRPDLSYAVNLMGRVQTKDPWLACEIGEQALGYVKYSGALGLCYKRCKPGEFSCEESQVQNEIGLLEVAADISHAPEHEDFKSVQGILIAMGGAAIQWESTRQSTITGSTAEGELLSYQAGYQCGESIKCMVELFNLTPKCVIYGDNKAAISLATLETGPWKTRHLRHRAAQLREAVRDHGDPDEELWELRHMSGKEIVADGLTKPLLGQAFAQFRERLGMVNMGGFAHTKKFMVCKVAKCALAAASAIHVAEGDVKMALVYAILAAVFHLIGFNRLVFRPPEDGQDPLKGQEENDKSTAQKPKEEAGTQKTHPLEEKRKIMREVFGGVGPKSSGSSGLTGTQTSGDTGRIEWDSRHGSAGESSGGMDFGDGDSGMGSLGKPKLCAVRVAKDEFSATPWMRHQFCRPPTATSDKWLEDGDFVIRQHGARRKRAFHPLHKGAPIDGDGLDPWRLTVKFAADRTMSLVEDRWDRREDEKEFPKDDTWVGWTFFKKRPGTLASATTGSQPATMQQETVRSTEAEVGQREVINGNETPYKAEWRLSLETTEQMHQTTMQLHTTNWVGQKAPPPPLPITPPPTDSEKEKLIKMGRGKEQQCLVPAKPAGARAAASSAAVDVNAHRAKAMPKALELSASFAGATMGSVGYSHGGPSDRAKPVMGQGNWRRPTPKPSSIPPQDDEASEWEQIAEV